MKEIKVVGAILVREGKILCAKRGKTKTLAHYWEFPGGKIEKDETPREALERELKEELNIEVIVASEKYEQTIYPYDFGKVDLTTFICHLKNGEPKLTEHTDIRWLLPKELQELTWAPADIPTVKKIIRTGVDKWIR